MAYTRWTESNPWHIYPAEDDDGNDVLTLHHRDKGKEHIAPVDCRMLIAGHLVLENFFEEAMEDWESDAAFEAIALYLWDIDNPELRDW